MCHGAGSPRNSNGQPDEDECKNELNRCEGFSRNLEEAAVAHRVFAQHHEVDLESQSDVLRHEYHAPDAACYHLETVSNCEWCHPLVILAQEIWIKWTSKLKTTSCCELAEVESSDAAADYG